MTEIPSTVPVSATFHWSNEGKFSFHIESHGKHQENIRLLFDDQGGKNTRMKFIAMLKTDNENLHDDKSVAIYIKSSKIGYLSRADARSFRRRLGAKQLTGQDTSVDVEIIDRRVSGDGRPRYFVKLDLKRFS